MKAAHMLLAAGPGSGCVGKAMNPLVLSQSSVARGMWLWNPVEARTVDHHWQVQGQSARMIKFWLTSKSAVLDLQKGTP